ncbi:MAG: DUF2793 domain-containing protein [Sandaracinobacteroides sp.]
MTETTARFGLPLLVSGQGQKDITHNEALLLLDALAGAVVEARTFSVPPADPLIGRCWLVSSPAGGAWLGKDDQIAIGTSGGWRFAALPEGMLIYVKSEALEVRRLSGGWQNVAPKGAPVPPVSLPVGGTLIDLEARTAIADIALRLQQLGLLSS